MSRPLCFVLMPFGKKPGAGGAVIDFDAVYRELIEPAIEAADLDAAPRRRGAGRRDHPQADVRAADPVRVRGRRSHHRQRQRLLRARRAPRRQAGDDGAAVRRRRRATAVRCRAAAHAAVSARTRRQAGRRRGGRRQASRRLLKPRPGGRRRQPGLSAGRGLSRHPAHQDRRLPRTGGIFARRIKDQLAAGAQARASPAIRAIEQRPRRRSIASRPACWSTCSCPTGP